MNTNMQTQKLGDFIKLEYGKPLDKSQRCAGGAYPVYGANGEKDRSNDYYFDKPTIIIGRKGSAGEIKLTEEKFWPLDVTYFVDYDSKKTDLKFLYYLLGTLNLPKLAKGVKPGINRNDVYSIDVPIISLPEQKRIVKILDEAFAGIEQAKINAEQNLKNARELFDSALQSIFNGKGEKWTKKNLEEVVEKTCSLSYGIVQPGENVADGLPIVRPTDLQCKTIFLDGLKKIDPVLAGAYKRTTLLGNDLLLCVRGSTGMVSVASKELAGANVTRGIVPIRFEPSIINQGFGYYLMISKNVQDQIRAATYGAALMQINIRDLRNISLVIPPIDIQNDLLKELEFLSEKTKNLEVIYQQKLDDLEELKKSILQKAFAGELTAESAASNVIPFPKKIPDLSETDLHAGIIARAYRRHEGNSQHQATFGHVKAEKIAHMVEAYAGVDLGRNPVKDAAGPNDFSRLREVEEAAKDARYFEFYQERGRYKLRRYTNLDQIADKVGVALGELKAETDKIIDLMVPMKTEKAEIIATVFAAWNNLLIQKKEISDEAIVYEARENWHADKLKIERPKFFNSIKWLKDNGIVPQGRGKLVREKSGQEQLL